MDTWQMIKLALAIAIAVAIVVELYLAIANAPMGFEDSGGFHRGEPGPESDWSDWE